MFDNGKAAIVTGAGPGMGRSIAVELARQGVDVTIAARRSERLEAVADDVRRIAGREPLVMAVDITDPTTLQEATKILTEEVKLTAHPQTYIIMDLVDRAIVIKNRGAELHRLPIEQ